MFFKRGKVMNIKNLPNVISSLKTVLDSVQANIFIADPDFKLVYMNPKAKKTLNSIEYEIFEVFNIRVIDLVGGSIHRFHRDPDQVERILKNPMALPNEAIFKFGDVKLKTSINRISGPENELTGYIVNWEDISERVKLWGKLSNKINFEADMESLLLELEKIEKNYGKI